MKFGETNIPWSREMGKVMRLELLKHITPAPPPQKKYTPTNTWVCQITKFVVDTQKSHIFFMQLACCIKNNSSKNFTHVCVWH